ncbi:hypothetical protein [Paenarthrobacter sp. A20]|uniref:hypothetical protein n=1 Tax=Paenarthrobacter sp. A20 TaxID=2817891 RepID=UPI0020A1BDBC|nr:hypothetical protein [Paenarthrobacter sp. A20]MCP1411727.1 biotin-(acetyl-CoA carboxylase) ligase [Paenarthrobacter sp. A20]
MDLRRIDDWSTLSGANVQIRLHGHTVCAGIVDAVTENGRILWILPTGDSRRLYEQDGSYEVWATEEKAGFHYRVSLGLTCALRV